MPRFRDLPLRRKLVRIILAASLATLATSGAAILVYELTSYRPNVEALLRGQVDILHDGLVASLDFEHRERAREDLEVLTKGSEVEVACVWDARGELFADFGTDSSCPPAPPAAGFRFTDGRLTYSRVLRSAGDERVGHLYVVRPLPALLARMPQYGIMLGSLVFALLVVSLIQTAALERLVSGPILRLARAAREVRDHGDHAVRVKISGHDEIGELTEAFHQMLETLEEHHVALRRAYDEQERLQAQLLRAQKMESIGRLAGGVAHDFNNYLTVIVGSTDLTLGQLPPDSPARRLLENVRKASGQASNLTQQLLAFARQQIIEPRVIDPNRLLLDIEKMLASAVGDDVELAIIPHGQAWPIRADPHQMTQVLMNLVVNARDAMPGGGTVTIEISNVELGAEDVADDPEIGPGDYVMIEVNDTGIGMDHEALKRLFEPFFTTKEQGKGTGLGLATCYGIVKQSGGHIVAESTPGHGSVFRIYLVRSLDTSVERTLVGARASLPSGRETVLVVEDDPLVRQTAVSLLRAQGYTVLEAAAGPDAVRLVEQNDADVDLLMTDVVMPQMSGRDVAERLKLLRPGLKVLYVSGYTDVIVNQGELEEGIDFLQKPYTSETLMYRVRAVLDRESPGAAGNGEGNGSRPDA